jgi:hypothetical protein
MEIKTLNFLSGNPREKLSCIFILDDNNVELKKMTFYNDEKDIVMEPELAKTIDSLPSFLEYIYKMGKDGVKINFTKSDIEISSDDED